jgi:hypothetical protein
VDNARIDRLRDLLVIAGCCIAISIARPRLATTASHVKERYDSYLLPPTHMLVQASMGYRQALADLIWADVLVTQGLRTSQRRPFDHLARYLEAISTLDPKFREPYKYADSLLTSQVNDPDKNGSLLAARGHLERGLQAFPTDAELWLNYGEFLAYVGPGVIEDREEQARWRADGAAALIHAGELGSKDENLMWHTIAAVGLLREKEAERGALIRFLERVYAMTEDEELREDVLNKLRVLGKDQEESRDIQRQRAFDGLWRKMPFINRTQLRIIGPMPDTWDCAGALTSNQRTDRCLRDWSAWGRTLQIPW